MDLFGCKLLEKFKLVVKLNVNEERQVDIIAGQFYHLHPIWRALTVMKHF